MEQAEEYLCLVHQVLGEGFWSIFGAVIGAFLGALFGFIVSICLDFRRESKLKRAFYNEAEFLSTNVSEFLTSVVSEYEKVKIDIDNGDSFSGPIKIDFGVFNALYLELYKTKSIPTDDCRRFTHNVSSRWESICNFDIDRVNKIEGSSCYKVDRAKCMEIVFSSVDMLYYFDLLASKKDKFRFEEANFKTMAEVVFSKYKIKNDQLIDNISEQRPR